MTVSARCCRLSLIDPQMAWGAGEVPGDAALNDSFSSCGLALRSLCHRVTCRHRRSGYILSPCSTKAGVHLTGEAPASTEASGSAEPGCAAATAPREERGSGGGSQPCSPCHSPPRGDGEQPWSGVSAAQPGGAGEVRRRAAGRAGNAPIRDWRGGGSAGEAITLHPRVM